MRVCLRVASNKNVIFNEFFLIKVRFIFPHGICYYNIIFLEFSRTTNGSLESILLKKPSSSTTNKSIWLYLALKLYYTVFPGMVFSLLLSEADMTT